jgi:hypothetical protein
MIAFRDIVFQILQDQNAAVERIEPDGLELIADPPLREALAIPEFIRLGFGEELPPESMRVSLESDWIERIGALMRNRGNTLRLTLWDDRFKGKVSDPETMLSKHIILDNSIFRPTGVETAWTRYLLLIFKITAISDEKREDIIPVCLNESNTACADHLTEPLISLLTADKGAFTMLPPNDKLPEPWPSERIAGWRSKCLASRIRANLLPFLTGMERRMSKDVSRLHDYHSTLRRETAIRITELKDKEGMKDTVLKREEMRMDSIEREYHAKIADLKQKYAMNVEARLSQILRLAMPVNRIGLLLMRRKGKRQYHLDYNHLSRRMDSLSCEACGASTASHALCDERLHILCPACFAACGACGKEYCRACHPMKCPSCKKS